MIRDPETGTIVTVLNNYTNLSRTETRGVDIDMRATSPARNYGRFTTRLNVTYVDKFEEDDGSSQRQERVAPTVARTRTRAGRATCRSTGTRVRGRQRARVNYIHSY